MNLPESVRPKVTSLYNSTRRLILKILVATMDGCRYIAEKASPHPRICCLHSGPRQPQIFLVINKTWFECNWIADPHFSILYNHCFCLFAQVLNWMILLISPRLALPPHCSWEPLPWWTTSCLCATSCLCLSASASSAVVRSSGNTAFTYSFCCKYINMVS